MYYIKNYKMKFNILLFIVFLLIFKIGKCQNVELKQEFIGTLRTSEGSFISYKLIFIKDELGKITGKSITDFYGKNCTETLIEGTLNSQDNTISFKEVYENRYEVMDLTAFTLCEENKKPIYVFDMNVPGNLLKALQGDKIGTLVS